MWCSPYACLRSFVAKRLSETEEKLMKNPLLYPFFSYCRVAGERKVCPEIQELMESEWVSLVLLVRCHQLCWLFGQSRFKPIVNAHGRWHEWFLFCPLFPYWPVPGGEALLEVWHTHLCSRTSLTASSFFVEPKEEKMLTCYSYEIERKLPSLKSSVCITPLPLVPPWHQ